MLEDFPSFLSSSAFPAINPTSPNSSIPSDTFTPIKSRSPPPSTSRNYQSLSSPLSNDLVFVLPNDYSPVNNSNFNVAYNNSSLEYPERLFGPMMKHLLLTIHLIITMISIM